MISVKGHWQDIGKIKKKGRVVKMPRSFLVKKKRGASGGWQWKEPEQLEWKEDDVKGKIFS